MSTGFEALPFMFITFKAFFQFSPSRSSRTRDFSMYFEGRIRMSSSNQFHRVVKCSAWQGALATASSHGLVRATASDELPRCDALRPRHVRELQAVDIPRAYEHIGCQSEKPSTISRLSRLSRSHTTCPHLRPHRRAAAPHGS